MSFLEFWKHELSSGEIKAIKLLEQQIYSLDKQWSEYSKRNFTDWNTKFKDMDLNNTDPSIRIPKRDAKIEKKEFYELWEKTTELFTKTIRLIEKGKTQDAIILLFSKLRDFEADIDRLEAQEQKTLQYLKQYRHFFQKIIDNNYGDGYFDDEVIKNYEIRFKILEILKNDYEMLRYLLSDII